MSDVATSVDEVEPETVEGAPEVPLEENGGGK